MIYIRFYGELGSFLPEYRRMQDFAIRLKKGQTVEDIITAVKVPLALVDLILVNSKPAGFDYVLQSRDQISVYPQFRNIDITPNNLINRQQVTH